MDVLISKRMQRIIRDYKKETGKTEIDMLDVADYAISKGWKLPTPKDPLKKLEKEFTQAERKEIKDTKRIASIQK